MQDKNIHSGHRDRVKNRFLEQGLENMNDHQVLELLLFYSVPRKDTNELAHKLINSFGSISSVFNASVDSLLSVKGVTKATAVLLTMIPQLFTYYNIDKVDMNKRIDLNDACRILQAKYIGASIEMVYLMLLDKKFKLTFLGKLSEGNTNCSQVYTKKIITLATRYNASYAIMAHNHPGGVALPSSQDIDTTLTIKMILNAIGVELFDHIIIADDDVVSICQSDIYKDLFKK